MKKNTYAIDHDNKTITLTKAYAKLANTPGTKEFRELSRLHQAFPEYDIVMRTATITAPKEKHIGLSVDRMAQYIQIIDKDALAEFEAIKNFYKGMSGYYGKMKKWFLAKYPNYQEIDFSELAIAG